MIFRVQDMFFSHYVSIRWYFLSRKFPKKASQKSKSISGS